VDLTEDYIPPDIGTDTMDTNYSDNLDRRLTNVTRPTGSILPFFDDQNLAYICDGSLLTSTMVGHGQRCCLWMRAEKCAIAEKPGL
jgi:hypothetical protein